MRADGCPSADAVATVIAFGSPDGRRFLLLVPAAELLQRIGIDIARIERRAQVVFPQITLVHAHVGSIHSGNRSSSA